MRVGETAQIEFPCLPQALWPKRGQMSGLGQVPAVSPAWAEYMSSWKRAEAQLDYLQKATPSNWEFRVNDSLKLVPNEFKTLEMMVRGKTGNPEAEDQLFKLWGAVSKTTIRMNADKPGVIAQLKDKASIFFTDFWQGAKEGYQNAASWMIKNAGPVLGMYHGGLKKIAVLKGDLAAARSAGKPASEISEQEKKVANLESIANAVRATFSKLSGGLSIDQIAVQEFGPLSAVMAIVAAIALAAVAALVASLSTAALGVRPLTERAQATASKVDAVIAQAQGAAAEAKGVLEMLKKYLPWVIGGIVVVAGAATYYLVARARKK